MSQPLAWTGQGEQEPGDFVKAMLNILDDVSEEKNRLQDTQTAILNILEDFAAEKAQLQAAQKAVLNILEDFDAERGQVERVNRAMAVEIDERRRAEAALRRASVYTRSLIEASLDPLLTIGPDGRITDLNAATETVAGRRREELIGTDFSEYFTDPEAAREGYQSVFRCGFVRDYPLQVRHADGHTIPVLYNASVYRDEAGQVVGVFAAARDISALKKAERELQDANRQLQKTLTELRASQQQLIQSEKLSAIGTMAAGVAHELNNPMMGVLNYVENAMLVARQPEVKSRLEKANRELQRMRQILSNLLAFARPIVEETTTVDLAEVVTRAVELLEPEFKVRGIRVVRDIQSPLPAVDTKEGHLQQVFVNLLINARDAVEQSSEKTITVSARADDTQVYVEVADSGPGIPPEIQGRIFDPFFTTKPPGRGTGLGLSISQNIVNDVGGRLSCESEPGRGARFTVTVPRGPVRRERQ